MNLDCLSGCSSAMQVDVNGHLLVSYAIIWKFVALLAVHWIADFVLQTRWQASNKSKRIDALAAHVSVYTFALSLAVDILFPGVAWSTWVGFILLNSILHFATDWCTSRISSRSFMKQIFNLDVHGAEYWTLRENFTLHNFFVVVGLDQLIHQVTLALTMVYFFGGM